MCRLSHSNRFAKYAQKQHLKQKKIESFLKEKQKTNFKNQDIEK